MARDLVIVESPAKARTVGKFLGNTYSVKASIGHIRDLPQSQLGVDVERDFAPTYLVPPDKRAVVRDLREAAAKADSIYLATDPDREGEAISWHLMQAARIEASRVRRVVFHEITQEAVAEAFAHPRSIDMQLVNAQQARRILDRLVGYKLSPVLWQKVKRGLSAGRVQSVAVRLIVDREREIEAFVPTEYWTISVDLTKQDATPPARAGRRAARDPNAFRAQLVNRLGAKGKLDIGNEALAREIAGHLDQAAYRVATVTKREVRRQPAAPFTTSTLQQEASRKLRFTAQRTMGTAQALYEGIKLGAEGEVGLITYMRTDSTQVAASAQQEARHFIAERFGKEYVPAKPRVYTKKAKGAQEAHEAIRPTSVTREPEAIRQFLTAEQFRLYDLIWKRFVSSQMEAAVFDSTTVDIQATKPDTPGYLVRATGSVLKFPGFTAVYSEGRDDAAPEDEDNPLLPVLEKDELLRYLGVHPDQHFTQPPPRYTDATLIKALEELGIGRPSTYAAILGTIQNRGYVERIERKFRPTELGRVVNDLLVANFSAIVDTGFTAQMEEALDEVASGEREWVPLLREFYEPFESTIQTASRTIDRVRVADEVSDEVCTECGRPMLIKSGRTGKFLGCSGYPECKSTRPIVKRTGVACPSCGGDLIERRSKRGRTFYGCARYPECDFTVWNRPLPGACPECGGLVTQQGKDRAKCQKCGVVMPLARFEKAAG